MDIFESAFAQLGKSIEFGAIRIVDPDTNLIVQEKQSDSLAKCFPDLTPTQTKSYLALCLSSGKPMTNMDTLPEITC